ncbi:hypothetical protein [Cytobacillus firmus]|uniref:Uncharacterized protein n=1 Tax=Cytobacillus firmus DS1 TaxID=1307436 RepID=W7LA50_CYTFI|nr:hypothetical protein [Cytobacillus firmus]EWG12097.1 hypothetical protein PBF_04868 [Cytobacillus firmus DS1]
MDNGEETGYLYFQTENESLNTKHQPSFFDALQLIKLQNNKSYQRIPLRSQTSIMINDTERILHYKFNFLLSQVAIKAGNKNPTYQLLSCFIIKEGSKVTFLTQKPNKPEYAKIKEQPSSLYAYQGLED